MSELIAAPADPQDLVEEPEHVVEEPGHVVEAVSQPSVLITEQEVALSTAAAVPLPRTKPTHRVIAALSAMFVHSSEDPRPAPRHYPLRREGFVEDAAMEREMHRL